ncbi:MAG TPA: hypothetical protein VE442_14385 [Jatrophihabitans sp.]|nr:hypothetical protein [Jatrophihabitans sp.]
MRTLMWEARAAPGRDAELLAWALEHADPAADVYRGADGRVVVIDETGRGLPDAPAELLARPPHVWPFERVPR